MQIYVNKRRWISPASSNAKYPYTDMKVGDEAIIVPRSNLSPIDLHQLDHSVRQTANSARYSKVKESGYVKSFTTRKVYITSIGNTQIKDRVAFTVTRLR